MVEHPKLHYHSLSMIILHVLCMLTLYFSIVFVTEGTVKLNSSQDIKGKLEKGPYVKKTFILETMGFLILMKTHIQLKRVIC